MISGVSGALERVEAGESTYQDAEFLRSVMASYEITLLYMRSKLDELLTELNRLKAERAIAQDDV